MKRYSVLITAVAAILASCSDNPRHYDQLKAINKSLEQSNALIAMKTKDIADQVKTDSTQSDAWRRVEDIRKRSADVSKFIKSLKDGLGDLEKDKKLVAEVFVSNKKADDLYKKLAAYNEGIRDMFDGEDQYEIESKLFDDLGVMNDFWTAEKDRSDMWVKMNFEDASIAEVKAVLNMLQNDVLMVESRLVDYFRRL